MTNVASISSSAVLVTLNVSVWTGRKLDKQVSAEIDADKHTRVRAGNYHKNLMAGVKELEDVGKYAADTRNWFVYRTLPWGNEGTKIVPTANLFDFKQELSDRENQFWNLVEPDAVFQAAYPGGYSVDFTDGAHGQFFRDANIESLSVVIQRLLDSHQQAR